MVCWGGRGAIVRRSNTGLSPVTLAYSALFLFQCYHGISYKNGFNLRAGTLFGGLGKAGGGDVFTYMRRPA